MGAASIMKSYDLHFYQLSHLFLLVGIYIILVYFGTAMINEVVLTIFLLLIFAISCFYFSKKSNLISILFWLPIYLSALQNLVLINIHNDISQHVFQFILILNYISIFVFLFPYLVFNYIDFRKDWGVYIAIFLVLTIYSSILLLVYGAEITSFFAYYRNISSPLIFFMLGVLVGRKIRIAYLTSGLFLLISIVFLFGIFERFINPDIWIQLDITSYWLNKGLNINPFTNLPGSFYSSEKISGEHIRRMVSTYADPIHFGTISFLLIVLSWYFRLYILMFLMGALAIFSISKGAILSIFVFLSVWFIFNGKLKVAMLFIIFVFGLVMLDYFMTLGSSTGVHVYGFIEGISNLAYHPFGHGLGNVGVLASQFHVSQNSLIAESGIGVIAGQLGILGVGLFLYFFLKIHKEILCIKGSMRDKVLLFSLLYSIFLNISFNEVALSPNSSAGYFALLGIFLSNKKTSRRLAKLPHGQRYFF